MSEPKLSSDRGTASQQRSSSQSGANTPRRGQRARQRKQITSRHGQTDAGQGIQPPHVRFSRGRSSSASTASVFHPQAQDFVAVHDLKKSYRKANLEIPVLKGVSFAVREGEFIAIVGQSGSGKSTLLHLLGTLDAPDSGELHFAGRRIDNLRARERDRLRNNQLGMIFQFYHLLPELTTLENVLVPKMIRDSAVVYWARRRSYLERAKHLLELVGLSHRATHKPRELSGGEMQRCAIARALISQPRILLADEPTGNLDSKNGEEIMKVLRRLNHEERVTTLMVTHDMKIADQSDRVITLVDGRVQR